MGSDAPITGTEYAEPSEEDAALWAQAQGRGAAALDRRTLLIISGNMARSLADRGVRDWHAQRDGGVVPAKTLLSPPAGAVIVIDRRVTDDAGRRQLGLDDHPDAGRIVAHESWHAAIYCRGEPVHGPQKRSRMSVKDQILSFYGWQAMDEYRAEKAVMSRWAGPSSHKANLVEAVARTRDVSRRNPEKAFESLGAVSRLVGEAAAETLTGGSSGGGVPVDTALWERTVKIFSEVPEAGQSSSASKLDPLCAALAALLDQWCVEVGFVIEAGPPSSGAYRITPST